MSTANSSSAPASAQTSSSKPATPTSESGYLTEQANQASRAISNTITQLKTDLVKTADPRLWLNEHPWMTLVAATVGGFVAASVTVPSKEQQALKRLEKIERALNPDRYVRPSDNEKQASKDRGIIGHILHGALGSLQPALMSALAGALSGKVAQPDPNDMAAAAQQQHS